MPGFLQEVAADLYDRYGDDISSLSVLFPSRRARLFFIDALSGIAERPLWQPRWTTIDELMSGISGLRIGDRVRLVTELYKVYSEFHPESFDKFYFWGEMLLTDFDTIDKYLIDAQMLFRNISEIKEIEADISYLTPAQLRILSFWSSFGEQADLSEEKRRFLAIWKTLGPIYRRFRERLSSLGIAWHGAARRRRPHPRGRVRLPRAPALCRGGVQRPFRVREAPFRVPRHGGRNRFLLGLRLLL